ncbi:hypothetical protein MRX96_018140 [Rhipicephalus microplus]
MTPTAYSILSLSSAGVSPLGHRFPTQPRGLRPRRGVAVAAVDFEPRSLLPRLAGGGTLTGVARRLVSLTTTRATPRLAARVVT